MKKKRYYKCSGVTPDAYLCIGFIMKDEDDPVDRIADFFKNDTHLKYDGVYLPLTECEKNDLKGISFIYKETIFGWWRLDWGWR